MTGADVQEKVEGLAVNRLRSIGVTLMVVGVAFLVGGIVWDLNGGPSWLHAFTWVGGGAFSYGLVTLITANRGALK